MNVNPRPEKDCPTCGEHFVCIRPEQKYCSRKCIPAPGRKHLVCPCGVNTGSYQKKYCSDEHREQWGRKKAPVVMVTHTCLGCGEDFERPHYYPGKKKYCSNRCAHKEQKMTTEVAALCENGKTVIFRSEWEIRFYAACLRFNYNIRSYDGPDIQTSQGVYRPDFIIHNGHDRDPEIVVDVKGYLRPESKTKMIEAALQGVNLLVVDGVKLRRFEMGDDFGAIIQDLGLGWEPGNESP